MHDPVRIHDRIGGIGAPPGRMDRTRDLLGVLGERADASRVEATLLELDAGIAGRAAQGPRRPDLPG